MSNKENLLIWNLLKNFRIYPDFVTIPNFPNHGNFHRLFNDRVNADTFLAFSWTPDSCQFVFAVAVLKQQKNNNNNNNNNNNKKKPRMPHLLFISDEKPGI